MTYLFKTFAFTRHGNSVIPNDLRPSQACWDAHYEWVRLSKKEQEKYKQ